MPLDKCPDTRTLEQLLLGKLPAEQFELLSDHLEKCSICTKTAETLVPADEVTNALKAVTILHGDEELLAQAIERGKQLGSQAPTVQPDVTVIGSAAESPAEVNAADGFTLQNNPTELSFLAPAQQPDELGRLGSYRILQILGVGGMGIVFRAEDPALRRQVALKVMKPSVAVNQSAKDRFLREAQFTAAIEHDNIVAIFQVGEDQGVPFIAMPLLKGESLKARLEREGKVPQADVLRIGREIASGLAAAHERDLIHRDIKPDNIWLEEKTNRARILDFGLVRAASEDAGLTQSGTVMGTPRYMAPEQAMGQDVDFRCDLFSLGAVLYQLVSGKLPFEGSNVTATLMAVVQKDPLPLERVVSGLHPTLGKLIHKLMAKDREKRPKSAKEVAKLLAAIYQDLRQTASKKPESPSTANAANIEAERREPSGVSSVETPNALTGGLAPSRSNLLSPAEPLAALPVILTEPSATIPGRKASKRTQASTDRRPPGKPPVKKLLAALGAGGILLTLLGIIVITIRNKDGKETTIRVSEGTETDVAAEPGSKVLIRQESANAANTTPMKADAALAEYFALNRRAAEKALAVGGPNSFVGLEDTSNHKWHFSHPGQTLPDGPFLVRKWSIINSTTATNADLEVLRGLRHIRDINLGAVFHRLDAGALQHIAAIRAPLEYLSFHSPIKTSDLVAIPSFQQLHTITVLGPDVDDDWAFVKKFPHLRSLFVNTGPWPDLTLLSDFPQLRVLLLTGEDPDPTAVAQLQQKNPQLRILASSDGKQFRIVGQDPLREAVPGLLQAGLPLTAHLFDGTSKPVQPDEVDSLFAGGVNFLFCHAIPPDAHLTVEQRQQLTLLYMENLHANGQQEADLLAAALSGRTDLRSLNLQNSDLTDAGLKHLEALVGLSGLDVIGTRVTPAGLKAFRAAVPGCTLVTSDGTLEPDYLQEPAGANRSPGISQHAWPADAPRPAIAAFDAAQATAHQEAWARYLGVPVEQEFVLPGDEKLTLILIPPGQFVREENGQFPVKLTEPFYMGKYEVTQAQWKSVMRNNPSQFHDKATHPVERVSWNDVQPFLAKLNENASSTKMHFSLPTEAQWEYACRAGTTTTYSFGDSESELSAYGWFLDNSGSTTHPVGQLKPNPFGLCDLHGNVVELCTDWKEWGYYAKAPFQDPPGPQQGTSRVARSAGWEAAPIYCKSGSSHAYEPEVRTAFIGFRVTASIDDISRVHQMELASANNATGNVAPSQAIVPFDASQAKAHQEAWAKHLGVPVEYTNSVGMKFRLIPPGEFLMGSTQDDVNAQLKEAGEDQLWQAHLRSETPQHKVVLTQPYYVGMHEVTQHAYAAVTGSNPSSFATMGTDPVLSPRVAGIDTSNFPVENVNWMDANEFCRKLSEKESLQPNQSDPGLSLNPLDSTGYRLPTEAEWEYACRAGTTTRYWVGDTLEEGALAGWFNTNCFERTHAAGETRANPFGLYDMHGNVSERVNDYWAPNYYEQLSGQEAFNPAGPGECAPFHRGIRGGGWYAAPLYCKSGRRESNVLTWSDSSSGFRVVLPLIAVREALKSEPRTDSGQAATMPQPDSWKSLFDGTSFAGWQGADGGAIPDGWRIVDGIITASDTKTSIGTLEEFSDFELEWEFMVAAGSNGGVFYGWHGHYLQNPVDGWILTAPEYQIVDNVGHPNGQNPQSRCAAVFGLYSPSSDPSRPAGEWNTARLVIRGTNVEHWLNGEQVVRYMIGSEEWNSLIAKTPQGANPEFGQPGPGRVAFQSNTGTVSYRSIRWRSLTGNPEKAAPTEK